MVAPLPLPFPFVPAIVVLVFKRNAVRVRVDFLRNFRFSFREEKSENRKGVYVSDFHQDFFRGSKELLWGTDDGGLGFVPLFLTLIREHVELARGRWNGTYSNLFCTSDADMMITTNTRMNES